MRAEGKRKGRGGEGQAGPAGPHLGFCSKGARSGHGGHRRLGSRTLEVTFCHQPFHAIPARHVEPKLSPPIPPGGTEGRLSCPWGLPSNWGAPLGMPTAQTQGRRQCPETRPKKGCRGGRGPKTWGARGVGARLEGCGDAACRNWARWPLMEGPSPSLPTCYRERRGEIKTGWEGKRRQVRKGGEGGGIGEEGDSQCITSEITSLRPNVFQVPPAFKSESYLNIRAAFLRLRFPRS